MYIYDINTYLKNDSTLISLSEKDSIEIEPAVGYEDSTPPVIVWWYFPGMKDIDLQNWREDQVRYTVMDDDAVRCIAVGERIISLLNKTSEIRRLVSSSNTGRYSYLTKGELMGPVIRDGWFRYRIDFTVSYTP